MHLPEFLTKPEIIGLASSPRDSKVKKNLDSFLHPHFLSFTTKVTGCAPGIQLMDWIVPHEEDGHEEDTSPFTTCELQNG